MEKLPDSSNLKISQEKQGQLEDLRVLAELLELKIVRESEFHNIPTIVIEGTKGEVYIGYPHGRMLHGKAAGPSATGRIAGIRMQSLGDLPWDYVIEI